jgi:hypothetical protein
MTKFTSILLMDKIIVIVLHLKEANTAISPKFPKEQ